ncbi:hypothetical protein Apa02nite_022900 [Actinoplanes palleronii]|uniref:Uncharacterized protein n=1 Tax=Actinoplanes palleronii TaxID=113570 RepID=A0ABQ4B675_9ACTN|nr:hypothetical protein Apa02nite_022900 [Actinoplanes palleronii]
MVRRDGARRRVARRDGAWRRLAARRAAWRRVARLELGADSERGDRPKPAAPFIPPVWYRARPWDPPITNDAAWL